MNMPPLIRVPQITSDELDELSYAKSLLEHPGLTARLAGLIGGPLDIRSFGCVLSPVTSSAQDDSTSELLRFL